jgi:hypothetical protein
MVSTISSNCSQNGKEGGWMREKIYTRGGREKNEWEKIRAIVDEKKVRTLYNCSS